MLRLVWVICRWSLAVLFLREEGVTRTRTLGRERTLPSALPPSKYSMSSDVCEVYFLCTVPLVLVVLMVTGVPSSGMLYDVLSVRDETLVSMSSRRVASRSLSTELRVEGLRGVSVGRERGDGGALAGHDARRAAGDDVLSGGREGRSLGVYAHVVRRRLQREGLRRDDMEAPGCVQRVDAEGWRGWRGWCADG